MSGPIYVGGAGRSGKTLVRWALASHSRIAVSRRADMWPRFYGRFGSLADPGNLERCLHAMLARPQVAALVTDPERLRSDVARESPTYGRLFALVHEQHAARCGKLRWGDQSGLIERFAEPVLAAFPDARILHLVRDPRDRHEAVAAGGGRRRPRAAARSAASWLRSARLARRNAARWPDNYRIVRYETLVTRPEESLREVCAFVGERYEPAMLRLDAARRYDPERTGADGCPISAAYVGRHRGRVGAADLALIQGIAGRAMAELGFALDPPPLGIAALLHRAGREPRGRP
jgi:Sulfotransferase family